VRNIDIVKESADEGAVRYIATTAYTGSFANSPRLFATTSVKQVDGHYILSRHRAKLDFAGTEFYARGEIPSGGTDQSLEEWAGQLEQAFGVEHDYKSANERAHKEILKIVASREGRRRWTTVRDYTTPTGTRKRAKIVSRRD